MLKNPRRWYLSAVYANPTVNKHATTYTGTLNKFARVAVYPSCIPTSAALPNPTSP